MYFENTSEYRASATLLCAVRVAEQKMIQVVETGPAPFPTTPFDLLLALAIYTGMVLQGGRGECTMTKSEMLGMQQWIVECPDYTPSSLLPFSKEEMRRAYVAFYETTLSPLGDGAPG